MSVHMRREIEQLKKNILVLCAIVEEQVEDAVRATLDRNVDLAHQVGDRDQEIDRREVEIEEDCLKILALYQPVAFDLRFIVSALKINSDLERIGDLAVNIARKAVSYSAEPPVAVNIDLRGMWEKTQTMLHESINSLININSRLAENVCRWDDEVDRFKHEIRENIEEQIRREPEKVRPLLRLLAVSRNLERVADYATNISEDVIYMCEGRIIRHSKQNIA